MIGAITSTLPMDPKHDDLEAFIGELIKTTFHREVGTTSVLGRDSNNFVRSLSFAAPVVNGLAPSKKSRQPGAVEMPSSIQRAVMRVSNSAALISDTNRVRNEVAAMVLVREALHAVNLQHLVPQVYGWHQSPDESERSWILLEHKEGAALDEVFAAMETERKSDVLAQVADVFKAMQQYVIPASVRGYGGLTFTANGEIAAGPYSITGRGPTDSLAELHLSTLHEQLDIADNHPEVTLNGWRNTSCNLRQRLDKFAAEGLLPFVQRNSSPRQTLVHGDFSLFNMLIDESSGKLTALLDFDFSHVASVADEFMLSFTDIGGLLTGPFEPPAMNAMRKFQLSSVQSVESSERHEESQSCGVDWDVAIAWRHALQNAQVVQARDIPGIDEYSCLIWFLQHVCPPYLMMPRWLSKRTPEQVDNVRAGIVTNLDNYLTRWGY